MLPHGDSRGYFLRQVIDNESSEICTIQRTHDLDMIEHAAFPGVNAPLTWHLLCKWSRCFRRMRDRGIQASQRPGEKALNGAIS